MLDFIPQPKNVKRSRGFYTVPHKLSVGISGWQLHPPARQLQEILGSRARVSICRPPLKDDATIRLDDRLRPEGYRLAVSKTGIRLEARDVRAATHGLRTLAQVVRQYPGARLPYVRIDDWPDFSDRGVYYDVCRGRVPTLGALKQQIDLLAAVKINQLQYYIEHTFRFRRHPDIGKGASPLTADDILELDAYARERHVELVPSLASFGHLEPVLRLPQYRHLAESEATGEFWSLSPALPESYQFLEQLYDEFLPCFSSKRFNICCDEVSDLGRGKSADLAKRIGPGRLYLGHIKRVRRLAARHGKKVMFWGDIIRKYPELIDQIPKDVTVLDWGYSWRMPFGRIRDFTRTGLATYVCPSVNGYVTLFPQIHNSAANISGWARAGKKHGATGLLNTDWGDGGHYNFMECAWPGYLLGAEQSWNSNAEPGGRDFWRRFSKLFLNIEAREFVDALIELGDISSINASPYYQSIWTHILLFSDAGDDIFQPVKRDIELFRNGRHIEKRGVLDAALGRECAARLRMIRRVFARHFARPGSDPHRVGDYWLFAVDTMTTSAGKLAMFGAGGRPTAAGRRKLRTGYGQLMKRFEKLWMARNRRSDIRLTLGAYRRRIKAL